VSQLIFSSKIKETANQEEWSNCKLVDVPARKELIICIGLRIYSLHKFAQLSKGNEINSLIKYYRNDKNRR